MKQNTKKIVFWMQLVQFVLISVTFVTFVVAMFNINGKLNGFFGFLGSYPGLVFFGVLPCFLVILGVLVIQALLRENKQDVIAVAPAVSGDKQATVIIPKGKKKNPKEVLEGIFAQIKELGEKPRVTPKMVLKPAQKLEKFKDKTEFRNDVEIQKSIRSDLNWCYKILGDVQYDVEKTEKRINKRN
jgi:hypothetical protein